MGAGVGFDVGMAVGVGDMVGASVGGMVGVGSSVGVGLELLLATALRWPSAQVRVSGSAPWLQWAVVSRWASPSAAAWPFLLHQSGPVGLLSPAVRWPWVRFSPSAVAQNRPKGSAAWGWLLETGIWAYRG